MSERIHQLIKRDSAHATGLPIAKPKKGDLGVEQQVLLTTTNNTTNSTTGNH